MAGYSARQSSFTTGDTILAAHSNDEFNQVLAAFHATTGHSHDGTAGEGGPVSTLRDADALNKILVDTSNNHLEFYVEVSSAAVQQLRIQDGAIVPITDNDIDLGTSSLEFKDGYFDGTVYADAINFNGTAIASTAAELNIVDGDTSATSTTVADADRVVLNDNGSMVQVAVTDLAAYFDDEITAMPNLTSVGTLTTLTVDDITINGSTVSDSGDFTIDGGADIILDADGGDIFFKDGGTTFGSATNTSGNLIIKSGTTTALTFSGADVTVAGDLTVSGDDITMGTNTAGNLLVADGTNFNSIAVSSLSEISTAASDDVFIAIDTSGGGLKKIARSAVVAGLATDSAISNVVEDTTPQLGGNLDTNSFNIAFDDAHGINDENGNEQIIFQTTSSAVNQFDITNAATGNAPEIAATGGDTNIDLKLTPKGSGQVIIDGNVGIDTGVIDLKNGGSQSVVRFYCESSNAHYAAIQAPAHSDFSGNVTLTLPASSDTLAGIAATQTLTNKTLTTPVIAEIDSGSTITLDATTDIILDADGANITLKDGGTTVLDFVLNGATDVTLDAPGDIKLDADGGDFNFLDGGTEILRISNSSSDVIIRPVVDAKDIIFQQADGTEVARIEDNATFNVVTGKLAINGTAITSTAAELNLLDGVSGLVQADLTKLAAVDSTAAELNIVDGGTSATSTTLVDADRFVTNDNGTMVQVALSDLKTYLNSAGYVTEDPTALAIALG